MEAVQFRQATPSDAQTLWWIKHAAIDSIENDAYTDEQLRAWKPTGEDVSDFKRALESETFDIILAELEDEDVGYGVLNVDDGRIDALFVHPDHMGQGIATSLMGQLETRAQMHDIEELEIVSSLNAKSFYESLDYWDFGTKVRDIGGTDVEFAIMRKRL
jgi:GNAT superfamily N-acetyltransferase